MLKPRPGCFFFVVAPFCSCPASLVSRKFFAVGPGCAKCSFFCCAPLGAATFRRGQSKKKTPRVFFFFCSDPGERQGKEKPRAGTGPAQKKKTPPRVFFLLRPRGKAGEGEVPLGAGTGPEQKKTPLRVFFFCSGPVPAPDGASPSPAFPFSFPCLSTGPEPKKKNTLGGVFFFCSGPVPAPNGASPSLAFRRGRSKKKNTLGGVFFFALAPCRHGASPSPAFPRGRSKKKHPGWCFFAAAPRGRSLTHCGPGWRCLPLAGVVFVFLLRGGAGPGWCFFFAVAPPGRSLTHCGLGRFRQGPGGVFFFAAAPPGLFRQ